MADNLRSESKKQCNHNKSNILNPRLIKAAKILKNNEEILVQSADKTTLFDILNTLIKLITYCLIQHSLKK